jgi:hypothetical protein
MHFNGPWRTVHRHGHVNSTPDTNETKQALHRNLAETSAT